MILLVTPVAGPVFGPLSTRLRWSWVLLERTRILSGIQFTTHFIDIFVAETKRFVGSLVNVILTRQTCGQFSSRAAESKRRAPGNDFSEWICYMFHMSKCRGDWELGMCTFWVLAKRKPLRNAKLRFFLRAKHVHCAAVFFSQVPKKCTDLALSLLYILTWGTYSKFTRKNHFLAPGVCFLQPCSSSGRRLATSTSRLQNYRRIVSFPQQKYRWNAL